MDVCVWYCYLQYIRAGLYILLFYFLPFFLRVHKIMRGFCSETAAGFVGVLLPSRLSIGARLRRAILRRTGASGSVRELIA